MTGEKKAYGGEAPRDHSLTFAIVAIVLRVASWLAIPALIWILAG